MRHTHHKAPSYVVFCILLSLPPSYTQISSSTLFSNALGLSQCEWPSFTPTHNNRQNCSSVFSLKKVKQSHYRPGQAQRVQRSQGPQISWQRHRTVVGCQPYAPAAFTPRKYSWYSFLLEAESTPGPQCDRKDFISMKNPLTPAGIEPATSSTLTTVVLRSPCLVLLLLNSKLKDKDSAPIESKHFYWVPICSEFHDWNFD